MLSEELRSFLNEKIDSHDQFEVLISLYQNPRRFWTSPEISQQHHIDESTASRYLKSLLDRGLLNQNAVGAYYFDPVQHHDGELTEQLARLYRQQKNQIIDFINSKPSMRGRGFTEIFRFLRDSNRGF